MAAGRNKFLTEDGMTAIPFGRPMDNGWRFSLIGAAHGAFGP